MAEEVGLGERNEPGNVESERTSPGSSGPTVTDLYKSAGDDLFPLDKRMVNTVLSVLAHPGGLPKAIVEGQGNRFISPSRLVLSTGLLAAASASAFSFATGGAVYAVATWELGWGNNWAPWLFFLALAPVYGGLLKLVYADLKHPFRDHLVFAFCGQSVAFLLAALEGAWLRVSTPGSAVWWTGNSGFLFLLLGYLILAQTEFYGESLMKTLGRSFLLALGTGFLALVASFILTLF